jgi:hypothetical protein
MRAVSERDVGGRARCTECCMYHGHLWGSGSVAPPFLALAVDGGEWSASRSGRISSGTGGCMVPTVDLAAL